MEMNEPAGAALDSGTYAGVGPARTLASIRQSLLVLALAAALLLLANGRNTIPAAAWLAFLFLLRFVRPQGMWRGLLIGWLALSGAWTFQFRGMAVGQKRFDRSVV